jgi:hypothetical protein
MGTTTDEWHVINDHPDDPVQVELFYGLRNKKLIIEPYRDCRRELGYWDGETFCELNTGHSVFESWRPEEHRPTHWRALPPPPLPEAIRGPPQQ